MNLYIVMERMTAAGFKAEVVGEDRSSVLVVDGIPYGSVVDDKVYPFNK